MTWPEADTTAAVAIVGLGASTVIAVYGFRHARQLAKSSRQQARRERSYEEQLVIMRQIRAAWSALDPLTGEAPALTNIDKDNSHLVASKIVIYGTDDARQLVRMFDKTLANLVDRHAQLRNNPLAATEADVLALLERLEELLLATEAQMRKDLDA